MRSRRRRFPLILGMTLIAMVMIFPAGAAAAERTRTIPADVLGGHTWAGQLCNGDPVSVQYHVTERGRLVFDSVSGAPATERGERQAFRVRFTGQGLRVFVWVHWRQGVLQLHEQARQRPCPVAPPPPVDPNPQLG